MNIRGLPSSRKCGPRLFPAQIFLGARVDLDPVADVDENGNLHRQPGFERGGLGDVANGIALGARFGIRDLQNQSEGNVDVQRAALKEDAAFLSVLEEAFLAAGGG